MFRFVPAVAVQNLPQLTGEDRSAHRSQARRVTGDKARGGCRAEGLRAAASKVLSPAATRVAGAAF